MRRRLLIGGCYAITGGIGWAAHHFGGGAGVAVWLVVALVLGWLIAPNGWADVP